MESSSQHSQQLPTLKQHIALILQLIKLSPNKEFYHLYGLCRQLVSNSDLHQVTEVDIDYFLNDDHYWMHDGMSAYYYDRIISTCIGPKTMRWFVESHLIPLIELHIKLSISGSSSQVTIESVENLL